MSDDDGPGPGLVYSDSYVSVVEDRGPCTCKPVSRWALMVKYHEPRLAGRRGVCRECGGIWPPPEPERGPGFWRTAAGQLAYPFRRQEAALDAAVLWCVACEVRALREGDEGRDAVRSADYVIDGMSVCAEDGAPMLAVLAERKGAR